ncbi:hypothetical protein [Leptolyngbya sp. FACHB-16]|uniref:hypothetical protein n=1 Tax=unclassified Leptolyngbya TaxID=2650499 RepID=UPI001684E1D3|nr:hypothetical protein [Leptolyngbya sp. FACHB-16]MBD2156266.1 hypothetical protein [Leptolyngbya sp. FACHB-16]
MNDFAEECLNRFNELVELPLAEFAEATKGINPKPCAPGFEPEAFLLREPRFARLPVKRLQSRLETEFLEGERIFSDWMLLAAEQANRDVQEGNRHG